MTGRCKGRLIFALVAIGAVVALPVVLNYIGLGRATDLLIVIAGRWPILFVVVALWTALIYRLWAEPRHAQMALGHLGQCVRFARLDRPVDPVLLVRGEFRQLQQDLWLARRGQIHDLDLAVPSWSCSAPSSMPRWSIRPHATPRRERRNPWERARRWSLISSVLRRNDFGPYFVKWFQLRKWVSDPCGVR